MIIRYNVACGTCGHHHTARVGVGYEQHQPYNFPCKGCGESIAIALEIGEGLIFKDNAVKGKKEGTIVNLDSFLLSNPEHTGPEHLMQRVKQGYEYLMAQKEHHEKKHGEGSFEQALLSQPERQQPSSLSEWKLLKKCWSLRQRNQEKLYKEVLEQANKDFYDYEPVSDFYDWLWRFTTKLSGHTYNDHFEEAMHSIATCKSQANLKEFTDQLRNGLFEEHLQIYFDLFKQYFEGYSDFNQVHMYCSVGIKIPEGHKATSQNFDNINSFYGNVFEAFTTLAETLACVNNVIQGRSFDQFKEMTLSKYKKLDKANRCNPFSMNIPFSNLCKNVDSQLRNSSHHGGFRFDQENSIIKYRAGKGGNGAEQQITYTDYILKCTNLFLALATLLRIELAMHTHM